MMLRNKKIKKNKKQLKFLSELNEKLKNEKTKMNLFILFFNKNNEFMIFNF